MIVEQTNLTRRKRRVRQRLHQESDRPRLSVFRSNKYFYGQIIDDKKGETLVAVSEKELKGIRKAYEKAKKKYKKLKKDKWKNFSKYRKAKKNLREIESTYKNKKYVYKELKHIKKEILETKFKMDEDEKDQ